MPAARRERFINFERIDRWAHWGRALTAPKLCKEWSEESDALRTCAGVISMGANCNDTNCHVWHQQMSQEKWNEGDETYRKILQFPEWRERQRRSTKIDAIWVIQFSLWACTWNKDFVQFGFYCKYSAWDMVKLQQGKQSWDGWCCKEQVDAWLHLIKWLGSQQRKWK